MYRSLLWLILFIVISCECTKVEYNKRYYNQSTRGELIPQIYVLVPNNDTQSFVVRILFFGENFHPDQPMSLIVMRGASILPTMLPRTQTYEGSSHTYTILGETLCERQNLAGNTLAVNNDSVRFSVSSSVPAHFGFKVLQVFDFVLRAKRPMKVLIYPNAPDFFRFSFPIGLKTIAVRVKSDNDFCGRVTIQKAECPVFDTEGQVILYKKYEHQTITTRGFIIVSREDFGDHIHLIFSVLPLDEPCQSLSGPSELHPNNMTRVKEFRIEIIPFQPNKTSIYMLLELFVILLAITIGIAFWLYDENNEDTEDSVLNGTMHFWTYTLSQIYAVIPLAIVLVSLRESESLLSSDTDYCNFNFECAIPWGPFKAANNMLSASSIIIVGLINFWVSWCTRRVRRLFPLNAWIVTTGILWTLMNICPQKHSFYLYTMAMLMTVVEAKFLLFGKRNGRNIKHYRIIGGITMIMIILNVFEDIISSEFWQWIWFAGLLWTEAAYVSYFSYAQGISKDENENVELIKLVESKSDRLEPVNNEASFATDAEITPHYPRINSEHNVLPEQVEQSSEPSTSENHDVVFAESTLTTGFEIVQENDEENEVLPQREGSTENLIHIPEIELIEPRRNFTKVFKQMYLILGLINILIWAITYYWFDSSVIILRVVQTDFAIYFVLYFLNKVSYEKVFKKSFYGLTILFVALLVAWGVISSSYLPAFVPWSPAESRTLNRSCFAINNYCLGMDWHDVLHFVTAAICFLYPLIVSKIDQAFKVNEPSRTF